MKGIFILLLCVSLSCFSRVEPLLKLNGLYTHTELSFAQFLVAIHTEKTTRKVEDLFDQDVARRMEMRVVANKIFSRKFNGMWVDGIAINTDDQLFEKHAQNIVQFSKMFKGSLRGGDQLSIDYIPGSTIRVILNNQLIGTIEDNSFFNILMAVWVGEIPMSSLMKTSLLAGGGRAINKSMVIQYEAVIPRPERVVAVSRWNFKNRSLLKGGRVGSGDGLLAKAEVNTEAYLREALYVGKERITKNVLSNGLNSLNASEAFRHPSTEMSVMPSYALNQFSVDGEVKTDAVAVNTFYESNESMDSVEDGSDVEGLEDLNLEWVFIRRDYLKAVRRRVEKQAEFPVIASNKPGKRSLQMKVTVNRTGEVTEVVALNPSKSTSRLSREASQAVYQANPLPEMPLKLAGDNFSFNLYFSLHWRQSR